MFWGVCDNAASKLSNGSQANHLEERMKQGVRKVYSNSKEEGFIQSKAMNEVDAGRDRATPAWVRHDDDEPLTRISP